MQNDLKFEEPTEQKPCDMCDVCDMGKRTVRVTGGSALRTKGAAHGIMMGGICVPEHKHKHTQMISGSLKSSAK